MLECSAATVISLATSSMCALSYSTMPSLVDFVFDENQPSFGFNPTTLWYVTHAARGARSMAGKTGESGLSESMLVLLVSNSESRKTPGL